MCTLIVTPAIAVYYVEEAFVGFVLKSAKVHENIFFLDIATYEKKEWLVLGEIVRAGLVGFAFYTGHFF